MTNNDIFKKLRVALQLRDDQIVEILQLVDFRVSKGELGNIFRNENHPNYVECGDQLLRNFLNGLVIHLRGTKEEPKNPMEVIKSHKNTPAKDSTTKTEEQPKKPTFKKSETSFKSKPKKKPFPKKEPVVEKIRFKNGKNKSKE
ncbi:conserved hypothetical protein [Flavobacterium sp. 9AF]|uniref:DUF1456 family protein n=1 Tax=Flavobacterium sp. 9AF TaxID=2653142 RepID=UPI0012EFE091|nr:DUF1456 family protein [Flavobacterium sp. 9AF]VXB69949.1 conserved hypothetical protein [Flavobacterium sp. 9AF]